MGTSANDEVKHVFGIPDLWITENPLRLAEGQSEVFRPIEFDLSTLKVDNPYAPEPLPSKEFTLPNLNCDFGTLEKLDPTDSTASSSESEHGVQKEAAGSGDDEEVEDMWKVAIDLGPVNGDIKYYTWEAFYDSDRVESDVKYVSEAGAEAFDAALILGARDNGDEDSAGNVIRSDALLNCLFQLALGRGSALFRYDEKKKSFVQVLDKCRMSGHSLESFRELIAEVVELGSATRRLEDFSQRTRSSSTAYPAAVSFACCVSIVLWAVEAYISSGANTVQSVLQLRSILERPKRLVSTLERITKGTKKARSNEELASVVFQMIQDQEHGQDRLRDVLLQLLASVARPFLEDVSSWVGLAGKDNLPVLSKEGSVNGFVSYGSGADDGSVPHFVYHEQRMPKLVSPELGKTAYETGRSLQILRAHKPEHPLCTSANVVSRAATLEWKFEWENMDALLEKALSYEASLIEAIRDSRQQRDFTIHTDRADGKAGVYSAVSHSAEHEWHELIFESAKALDQPPSSHLVHPKDPLQEVILRCLQDDDESETTSNAFPPPLDATPQLSFGPLLYAQARLVNSACLRLLFRDHDLRQHLDLQRAFHLFGDGVFTARLTTALFDPDLATSERQTGKMRMGGTMGLKLGSRNTWPPASSELRLALGGVLADCYHSSKRPARLDQSSDGDKLMTSENLPGGLSFAVCQLTDEEIQRCLDADSIYALDFLRLQYKPPPPIDAIITSHSLQKYDRIFKFLLRLARMSFVTNQLFLQLTFRTITIPAIVQKFRIEAHHFITALSAHIFSSAVDSNWTTFFHRLQHIERRMAKEDATGQLGKLLPDGLDSLRDLHETTLDRILSGCLLKKKQRKVMDLLEELMGIVLRFAKVVAEVDVQQGEVRSLYEEFGSKRRLFVEVCKGLSERKGFVKGTGAEGAGEGGELAKLLVRLDLRV